MGQLFSYMLSDLMETDFIRGEGIYEGWEMIPTVALSEELTEAQQAYLDKAGESDIIVENEGYTPEYSFIAMKDDGTTAGLCCMQSRTGSLLMISLHLDALSKKGKEKLLLALLGSVIHAVDGKLPEGTPVQFFLDDMFIIYHLEKMFEGSSEILHYQEFVYEL